MTISKHTSFHQTTSVSGLAELGPNCPVATVCLELEPLMSITGCCKITDAVSVLTSVHTDRNITAQTNALQRKWSSASICGISGL